MEPSRSVPPIGAIKPVTLWYRKGDKGDYEFNHLEDGHSTSDKPTIGNAVQVKLWSSGVWVREHAWLDAGKPPKVLHDPLNETARTIATSKGR
jgi:hypothetical protein